MSKSRGTGIEPAALPRARHERRSGCATTSPPSSTPTSRTSTSTPTISSRASTATWSASTSTSPAAPRISSRSDFDGELCVPAATPSALAATGRGRGLRRCRRAYEQREFGKAMRDIMALADRINHDVRRAPALGAGQGSGARRASCRTCARAPCTASAADACCWRRCCRSWPRAGAELFGLERRFAWSDAAALPPQRIKPYEHLMTRVDAKQLDALFDAARSRPPRRSRGARRRLRPHRRRAARRSPSTSSSAVDLRVARIVEAEIGRRRRQAAEADARSRRGHAHRVRRHQVGLRPGRPRGPPHRGGRQPRAAQDELRRLAKAWCWRQRRRRRACSCCRRTPAPRPA